MSATVFHHKLPTFCEAGRKLFCNFFSILGMYRLGPEVTISGHLNGRVPENFLHKLVDKNDSSIGLDSIDNYWCMFHQRLIFFLLFSQLMRPHLYPFFEGIAVLLDFLPCPVERVEHVIERVRQGTNFVVHLNGNLLIPFTTCYLPRHLNDAVHRSEKQRHYPNDENG